MICDILIRLSQNDRKKRSKFVAIAHEIDPSNDICSTMQIGELVTAKKHHKAFEEACCLSRRFNGDADAVVAALMYGIAARNVGAIAMAIGAFQAALLYDPGNINAKQRLADIYAKFRKN